VIHYRRTQVSWPAVIPLVVIMLIVSLVSARADLPLGLALVAAVTAVILLLFATMTVIVDDSAIEARFGVGVSGSG
jgi:hypothetical protein